MTTKYPPILSIGKVAYWSFYYVNGKGSTRRLKPDQPTINGVFLEPDQLAFFHPTHPNETNIIRATRLGILDTWSPVLDVTLSNGHFITYRNNKAKLINGLLWSQAKLQA